ncbi:ATP-binding protein [Paeniglutamicibacter sp. NPDC091659]|uniref:ATP-binding protein n=1 Tax=Paeniglutamicibacter sp. NPDC091659 TaxID=3364389 RepID=UPI0038059F45
MAWTPESIHLLLARLRSNAGDFTDVEVRGASKGCPDLKETLSAFGNMPGGGNIVLGLDAANGFTATGIEDPGALEALVASQAHTAVVPEVQVAFERVVLDGETVVIAKVAGVAPEARPCRTVQGNLAYLRQSDGQYRMSEQEVQQLLAAGARPRHDTRPVDETSMADLDSQLRDHFIAVARSTSRRLSEVSDEEVLRFKRVIEPQGDRLTLAGLYALGRYPQQFEPHLSITAVAEPATRGEVRNLDRVEFDGPLPELLDRAVEWVQRNTRTEVRFGSNGHGQDETEMPMVAVRELIANALVHRDLGPHTTGKNVQIRLTGDQLVVSSPGGLWGLSQDQLGWPGAKSSVNEFLYEICKMTRTASSHRVVEGEGGGLREVRLALRDAGLRRPGFNDNGVRFTASIPRGTPLTAADRQWLGELPAAAGLSEIQKQLLVSMHHGRSWNSELVQDEFGFFDAAEAVSSLQGLVHAGLAVATGKGASFAITPALVPAAVEVAASPVDSSPTTGLYAGSQVGHDISASQAAPALRSPEPMKTSKNAAAILRELGSVPVEVADISAKTGLTANQIRYALSPLLTSGIVVREGGQGHKVTTYSRAGS